ncbi:MAG: ABC transporter substrate binding protein [Bacillota bacterium]
MKRFTAIIITALLLLNGMTGCTSDLQTAADKNESDLQSQFLLEPKSAPDGKPYRIAVVDIDPYEPASQLFYNFVERLWELGWISFDKMPIKETDEIKEMVKVLASMDLGGYVSFDENLCYYMLYDEMGAIEASLKDAAKSDEGLDLILGMGTDPGLFVKDMNLDVPLLVPMATDPVASGIIESVENSGNPNIWALVEPNPMGRQLNYYNNMIKMKTIGMVVEKDSQDVAAIGIYEEAAEELGIKVVKKEISAQLLTDNPAAYYAELKQDYIDMAEKEEIDAFLLTINVINDPDYCKDLFQPFYDAKIPVLVSDGDVYVEYGGLLCVSSYDYRGYGTFTADVASTVFNRVDAGILPCEYLSSPHIVLNLDIAEKTNFPLGFRLLQSCDKLYSDKGGVNNVN